MKKYLSDDGSEQPEFSKTVMDDFQDEPAYRKCRATLSSSAKLDSLVPFPQNREKQLSFYADVSSCVQANSARWEPPHGRFRHFFHPWAEYVNVGAVLRHCAYEVMALHGCLHSEIQVRHISNASFLFCLSPPFKYLSPVRRKSLMLPQTSLHKGEGRAAKSSSI